jgi:hypothetical protein
MNVDTLRAEASEILFEFGNGMVYAGALGQPSYLSLIKENERLNYLWGIINNLQPVYGDTYAVGRTLLTSADVLSAIETIRHYKGRFNIDLSTIGDESEPVTPTPSVLSDIIRAGSQTATIGANIIVFSSPLSTTDYTVNVWVLGDGESQFDVGVITPSVNGFTVSDIIIEGTLYYQVIVNT